MNRSKIIEVMAAAICGPGTTCEACRNSAERALSALHAKGLAVVPVEPTDAMLAALHDKVLIRADPALRECSILNDRETYAAMLSASPYGKASMQEASAEREARSEQIPPGKEESK